MLSDSQVIVGTLDDQKLQIDMSGSKLSISFGDVVECGYQITPAKPTALKFEGMMASLKDGSRLLVGDFKTKLQITTDYCKLDILPRRIVEVRPTDDKGLKHTVLLAGGSKLSGVLGPKNWEAGLAIGAKRKFHLDKLLALTVRGLKKAKRFGLVEMKMLNGDIIYGKLDAKTVVIRTEFGEVSPDASGIMLIAVNPAVKPPAVMTMWSGAVHRGQLTDKQLPISLSPNGPTMKISPAGISSITWTAPN